MTTTSKITEYPDNGYNSFISVDDAIEYFRTRLHADDFLQTQPETQEAALITGFRAINELDMTIDPTKAVEIQALKDAQCEQALHELKQDLDFQNVRFFAIQNVRAIHKEAPRFSPRTLAILRPYLNAPVIQVTR